MEIHGFIQQHIDKDQCFLSFCMIFSWPFGRIHVNSSFYTISVTQPQRWRCLSCSHQYSQSLKNHPDDKMHTNCYRLNLCVKRQLQTEAFHQKNPLELSTARHILLVETMVLRTAEVLVLFVTYMPSLVEIMYEVLWFHCVRSTLSSRYRRSQHTDI